MKKSRKKIFFSWNQWTVSVLIWLIIGVIGWITAENKRVKAVSCIEFEENQGDIRQKTLQVIEGNSVQDSYRITYHANGGSGDMENSILSKNGDSLAFNTFTRTGYSFAGWSVSEGGEAMFRDGGTIYPVSDMVLYAVWEINKYPVILEDEGEGAGGFSDAVSYGSVVTINAGKKKGYRFDGWTVKSGGFVLNEDFGAVFTFTMPDEPVHLSANWIEDTYSVLVSGSGLGGTELLHPLYQSTVTIQAGIKEGYTFESWEVESGDIVLADPSNPVTTFLMSSSDIKIKANWKINRYIVTITNIGDENEKQLEMDYKEIVAVQAGERKHYYFCGWEVEDQIISFEDPLSDQINFTMPASDVKLHAVWKEIEGVQAVLNRNFYDKYNNSEDYRDNCYNINKKIVITKDMLDVQIDFSDKSSILAKENDYLIENNAISLLGENQVKIVLTTGNTGYNTIVSVTGYSPELDEVMQELGISKGDYKGLAAKVEQITAEINNYQKEIESYKQNLSVIKELLAKAGTDIELKGDFEQQLKDIQNAVKETIYQLHQKEEEFIKIKDNIIKIEELLGLSKEEEYKNLSDILIKFQQEIEKIKKNEAVVVEEINQIAEKLGIKDSVSNIEDAVNHDFFKQLQEKVDIVKEELELYEKILNDLKNTFGIVNTGSLKSQLNEIVNKIEQKLRYLEDLKDQIENQLEGDYGAENTEEMEQTEAIFVKIHALKTYANDLKQFYKTLSELLGFGAAGTKEEIYQTVSNLKDKVMEYDKFLNQIKTLIYPKENENNTPSTGEQTKEEADKAYKEIQVIVKQQEFLKEILLSFLEKEDISIENKEEIKILLEQIQSQKEVTDQFLNHLKDILSLDPKADLQEISQVVSDIKKTITEYWEYLNKVEVLIKIKDESSTATGSAVVTGSAVTARFSNIYKELSDMVKQQQNMSETIKQLLERETVLSETIKELQKLQKEINEQKQQTDQYLETLKKILDLEESADYQKVIHTVSDMREQLKYYITIIEKLIKQLGIKPSEEEQENLPEQLKTVLNKVLELAEQLAEQTKKAEESGQVINSLEQQIKELVQEKIGVESENNKLKAEVENLKKEILSSPPDTPDKPEETAPSDTTDKPDETKPSDATNKPDETMLSDTTDKPEETTPSDAIDKPEETTSSDFTDNTDSSDSEDESDSSYSINSLLPSSLSNIADLEKKNRLQQDKIAELEKNLQSKVKEIENFVLEKKRLSEIITDKDREIKELKEQIERLTTQLTEKETQVKEFEQLFVKQKPIQELLEKNQINYEQLIKILSESKNINNKADKKKLAEKEEESERETEKEIIKETIKESESVQKKKEEAIVQKEKREDLKTASKQSEENILETTEELSSPNQEEQIVIQELETEEDFAEELQEKSNSNKTILITIILFFILAAAVILVICGKYNMNHK